MERPDALRAPAPPPDTTPRPRWRRRGFGLVTALVLTAGLLTACDSTPVVLSGAVTYTSPVAATAATPGDSATPGYTQPLAAGVAVQLFADDAEDVVAETTTNPVGTYAFHASQVEDATYRLRFGDTWYGGTSWADATPVELSATSPSTVDQTLPWAGSISGTIVDADLAGVADVAVIAPNADGSFDSATMTDASGAFTLGIPQTGSYTVAFKYHADLVTIGGDDPTVFTIGDGVADHETGPIDVTTGLAPASPYTTDVVVTGASADEGLTIDVTGSGYTDLPNASTGNPSSGVYAGLWNPADSYDDVAADTSILPAVAFLWSGTITDGDWATTLHADTADLDPNVDYQILVWVAHGNPTDDTVLATAPVTLTQAQKDALFGVPAAN